VTPVRNPKEETMAQLTTLEEKLAEVGHWAVLGKINETALKLAGEKDPYEES
jgi:hypothetical protein